MVFNSDCASVKIPSAFQYEPTTSISILERLEGGQCEENMMLALKSGAIWPAFQPIVGLGNGMVCGFEVLARWDDAQLGSISPTVFIPLAERLGLIEELFQHILFSACHYAAGWPGDFTLAFNISPIQFKRESLFCSIVETVARTNFPLHRLEMEMTETAVLDNESLALCTVSKLKEAGVSIALDDFGTGFASLSRLHTFPFDKIKIDTSFVRRLDTDSASRKIVTSVIGLGMSMGMNVVAEGVETDLQREMLRKLGCQKGQGWLFGKPMAAELAGAMVANENQAIPQPRKLDSSPYQRLHQLDELYKVSTVGLCFLDRDLVHVSVNERFADLMGLTPDIMIGSQVSDFFPADFADNITLILHRVLNGEIVRLDEFVPPGTGNACLILCKRVEDEAGDVLGISVTAIDITDRKHAEASLHQLEEHIAETNRGNFHVYWAADGRGKVTFVSPLTFEGRVISPHDRVRVLTERIHPGDRKALRHQWHSHVLHGTPFSTCFRFLVGNNEYQWVRSRAHAHAESDKGQRRWFGVIENVDYERALEQRIADLEVRLDNLRVIGQQWSKQVHVW